MVNMLILLWVGILLLNCFGSAVQNRQKAKELDRIVTRVYREKILREFYALKDLVNQQEIACETKLNQTKGSCHTCKSRHEDTQQQKHNDIKIVKSSGVSNGGNNSDNNLPTVSDNHQPTISSNNITNGHGNAIPTSGKTNIPVLPGNRLPTTSENKLPDKKVVKIQSRRFIRIPSVISVIKATTSDAIDIPPRISSFNIMNVSDITLPTSSAIKLSDIDITDSNEINKLIAEIGSLSLLDIGRSLTTVVQLPLRTLVVKTVPKVVRKIGNTFEPLFKSSLPKIGKDIEKNLEIFFSSTLPKVRIGNHLEKLVTKTLPETSNGFGRHLDTFISKTLPDTGKFIGNRLKSFINKKTIHIPKNIGSDLESFFTKTLPKNGRIVGGHLKTFFTKTVSGVFGGRRRRQANRCLSCDEINNMSVSEVKSAVCGVHLADPAIQFKKMIKIANEIFINKNPIITKVTYRRTDVTGKQRKGFVRPITITYNVGGLTNTYRINKSLDLLNSNQVLGEELAKEIWQLFSVTKTSM